jgi:hypothetical protein
MSNGVKHDSGKPPVVSGLIAQFPRALIEVAKCSQYGKEKYGFEYRDDNFAKVEHADERYADAMVRHLLCELTGEIVDNDSHLMHAAHTAWNALARLEVMCREYDSYEVKGFSDGK